MFIYDYIEKWDQVKKGKVQYVSGEKGNEGKSNYNIGSYVLDRSSINI